MRAHHHQSRSRNRRLPARFAGPVLAGLLAAPLAAQTPADALFREFEPNGDFVFVLEGEVVEGAEIYKSDRAAAYLVLAPPLTSPILINPRSRSVEAVHLMKVAKRSDGTIDLLADAAFDRLDQFRVEGEEVHFSVNGREAKLEPRPWLLGEQGAAELRGYKPDYDYKAREYKPRADYLQALRAREKPARVRVYFGSWCPACGRLVPRVLALEEKLEGSKIAFEYYGLPSPLTDDPVAERFDVRGVPTGIVYSGGEEVARLTGNDWNRPEEALLRVLR